MRLPLLIATTLLASACAGQMQYKDSNAAVDANPACVGSDGRPGEAVPPWCKREQTMEWKSDSGKEEELDFSGAGGKDG